MRVTPTMLTPRPLLASTYVECTLKYQKKICTPFRRDFFLFSVTTMFSRLVEIKDSVISAHSRKDQQPAEACTDSCPCIKHIQCLHAALFSEPLVMIKLHSRSTEQDTNLSAHDIPATQYQMRLSLNRRENGKTITGFSSPLRVTIQKFV